MDFKPDEHVTALSVRSRRGGANSKVSDWVVNKFVAVRPRFGLADALLCRVGFLWGLTEEQEPLEVTTQRANVVGGTYQDHCVPFAAALTPISLRLGPLIPKTGRTWLLTFLIPGRRHTTNVQISPKPILPSFVLRPSCCL